MRSLRLYAALGVMALGLATVRPPPAQAQPPYGPPPMRAIDGTWYMNGNPDQPCEIQPRPDGSALFINEHGSQAWGSLRGNRVFIPDWSDGNGSQGLRGTIRGNRIVWPNGTYWSR
jgi:hypothetical protein